MKENGMKDIRMEEGLINSLMVIHMKDIFNKIKNKAGEYTNGRTTQDTTENGRMISCMEEVLSHWKMD